MENYLTKAEQLLQDKQYDAALAACEEALRLGVNAAVVYQRRGNILLESKRYEEALASYKEAIRLSPPDPDPRLYYGKATALKALAEQAHMVAQQRGYYEDFHQEGGTMVLTDVPPGNMSLIDLAERCTNEMSKYHRKEPSDDQYCLEIFRRALVLRESDAWVVLQQQFNENVRTWFGHHPNREAALRHDGEQPYIDDAFRRFWRAVSEQRLTFHTLASMLSYLHLCLNCAIMDALRAYSRAKEEPIPDYGQVDVDEPSVEDSYQEGELWEVIEALLPGEQEKRVAFLHFYCNLKPREIARYFPGEFSSEAEIYHVKRNIMERVLRNADKIRWQLRGNRG